MKILLHFVLNIISRGWLILTCVFIAACTTIEPAAQDILKENKFTMIPQGSRDSVVAATITPIGTSTQTPILTLSSSPEPSPMPVTATLIASTTDIPSPDSVLPLKGPLVGFRVHDDDGIYLLILDIGTGTYHQVRSELIDYPFEVLWHGNGCQVYVGGLIDLEGNVLWQRPTLNWDILSPIENSSTEFVRLSPDGQWLAYNILYGEGYFEGAEFSDTGIVNLSNPDEPVFITNDGLSDKFTWSPDSQSLAYKHVDKNGITQLFRTTPDGHNKQQLTFHTELFDMGYVIWSPDGRYIAYSAYQSSNDKEIMRIGWVDIVDLETEAVYHIFGQKDNFGGVHRDDIWWSLDSKRLVFSGTNGRSSLYESQIYWVDVEAGMITDSFFAEEVPAGYFGEVHAVGSVDQILFGSREGNYLLNAEDMSFELFPIERDFNGQIYDSESAPFDFPGEENCQY